MRTKTTLLAIGSALLMSNSAYAQATSKTPSQTPGHQMQRDNNSTGPGASEFSPGHKMQDDARSTAPGASEFAPGHSSKRTGTVGSGAKQKQ